MAQNDTVLNSIREYLEECPVIGEVPVYAGALPAEEAYAVNMAGGEPVYKKYIDGTKIWQYLFLIEMNEPETAGEDQKINGAESCQYLEEWFDGQNQKDIFPKLEGKTPVRVDTVEKGSLKAIENGYARYQMQCRLLYIEGEPA